MTFLRRDPRLMERLLREALLAFAVVCAWSQVAFAASSALGAGGAGEGVCASPLGDFRMSEPLREEPLPEEQSPARPVRCASGEPGSSGGASDPAGSVLGLAMDETRDEGSLDQNEAPMCDPSGASVVAEAEVPQALGGKLEELPCEEWELLLSSFGSERALAPGSEGSGAPNPPGTEESESRLGAIAGSSGPAVGQLIVVSLPESRAPGLGAQPGFGRGVFRPPTLH